MALIPCPSCNRSISTEASSCPGCGHPITRELAVAQQRQLQKQKEDTRKGALGCLVMVGLVVGAVTYCSSSQTETASSSAPQPVRESTLIAEYQVAAKRNMEAALTDSLSARYENVTAHKVGSLYVFCGRYNARNSFGGYVGFQRFIAAPEMLAVERSMTGFEQAWSMYCTNYGVPVSW